uniref:Uncharacterized protein n=1 Tax=Romanomermis culicivorax TaxID=13658 RepID=A0A915JWZ8_ROMCU
MPLAYLEQQFLLYTTVVSATKNYVGVINSKFDHNGPCSIIDPSLLLKIRHFFLKDGYRSDKLYNVATTTKT